MLANPQRSILLARTAVELEGCTHGNLHTSFQIRIQSSHELLLLRRTQSHPDDVGTIVLYHLGNGRIVELLHTEERQLIERHALAIWIELFRQVLLQPIQSGFWHLSLKPRINLTPPSHNKRHTTLRKHVIPPSKACLV